MLSSLPTGFHDSERIMKTLSLSVALAVRGGMALYWHNSGGVNLSSYYEQHLSWSVLMSDSPRFDR